MVKAAAEALKTTVEAVRDAYAPDPRLAVFEVTIEVRDEGIALVGACSELDALAELRHALAQASPLVSILDEIQTLPEAGPDELVHALVSAAVAPMLAGARVAETQVSQVVLGNRLVVLRSRGRWLQCRSPDGYIGWIHAGYVALMDESAARAWETGADGDAVISLGAEVLDDRGETIMRLPWGARAVRLGADAVRLPDGRVGRPEGELVAAAVRPLAFPAEGAAMCATATRWLGVPYLWGGVTHGGVDCSGLVQAVYRLHGHVLPRDSDQQSRAGREIDPGPEFESLRPGDLCFFTEDPGRVTHVVMSTGGPEIIHASLGNGGVARNSLVGRRSYERELRRIFHCARRFFD
ncbi:MAG TPA: SH3 domain-containing C40 family peptidase [Longimicrobium sp.]|nr:SH3 domain-containing C40 family peptidase [Longimicrobium sp.]